MFSSSRRCFLGRYSPRYDDVRFSPTWAEPQYLKLRENERNVRLSDVARRWRNDAQAPSLKDISAGTDGYAACQRPLNFKQVRLLNPRKRENEEEERETECRGHVRASALRNGAKNRPTANFDLYPACWHPSHFYRAFNSAFTVSLNELEKRATHQEKDDLCAAMSLRYWDIYRMGK